MLIDLERLLAKYSRILPRFPDGRIDYSSSKEAAVLNCFVEFRGKILLVKRSIKVANYPGKWNAVSGFIDEAKPLREKVFKELKEETGISPAQISEVVEGKPFSFFDPEVKKKWIVFPTLARLKKMTGIKLNEESTSFKWIELQSITNYDIVTRLEESLKRVVRF